MPYVRPSHNRDRTMSVLRCLRCQLWWTVHTLHPNKRTTTHRFCPDCIPALYPQMGDATC